MHAGDFTSRTITLRDGSAATLRRVTLDDAQGVLDLERACVIDGRGVVRALSDMPETAEQMRKNIKAWVEGRRAYEEGCMLVVERDAVRPGGPTVLGVGQLRRFGPAKVRHVAQTSLEVHPEAQRLGVGRAIMVGLLEWARSVGVNRIQLNVFADNHRAIGLYESLGFERVGYRRRLVRDEDGTERDDLEMGLLLDEQRGDGK